MNGGICIFWSGLWGGLMDRVNKETYLLESFDEIEFESFVLKFPDSLVNIWWPCSLEEMSWGGIDSHLGENALPWKAFVFIVFSEELTLKHITYLIKLNLI